MTEYEKTEGYGEHAIESHNVLVCSDTGRVIAVFYNDYDLDEVLEQLNRNSLKLSTPNPQ